MPIFPFFVLFRTSIILSSLLLLFSCSAVPTDPDTLHFKVSHSIAGAFPRFPHNTQEQQKRELVVLYTPDDISSDARWDTFHNVHSFIHTHQRFPKLKMTMQIVVENRYIINPHQRNIVDNPKGQATWRQLIEEYSSWLEYGNHGYHHSPDGDPNVNNHEFNGDVDPDAFTYQHCYDIFKKARQAYQQIGLNNDNITVMRFPGYRHTDVALQALTDSDFLAYFYHTVPHSSDVFSTSGWEEYETLPNNKEIIKIPDIDYLIYTEDSTLLHQIRTNKINAHNLKSSDAYQKTLTHLMHQIEQRILSGGGIVNFFDHYWEHSNHHINNVYYRWELLIDILHKIDQKYHKKIWWGFSSELARWLYLRRHTKVQIAEQETNTEVHFLLSKNWKPAWNMNASYSITFPKSHIHNKSIKRISYTYPSQENQDYMHLPENAYWTEGNQLHFSFPFQKETKVIIQYD